MGWKGLALLAALAIVALIAADAFTGFLGIVPRAGRPTPDRPDAASVDDAKPTGPTLSGGAPRPAVGPDAVPPPVDLSKVDRDLDLHGVVVTKDEKPVAGALLTAVKFPWRRALVLSGDRRDEEIERGRTRSATDGSFAIRLARGEMVDLRATAPEFAETEIASCQAGERVRVVLSVGARLLVVAKDEAGSVVPGVRLRLVRTQRTGRPVFSRRGTTDASGSFVFEGLAGDAQAMLSAEHGTLGQISFLRVDLPESGEVRQDVVLPAGRMITGHVTDAATSAPIEGASVGLNWSVDRPVRSAIDGSYAFPGWTGKGHPALMCMAPGYSRTCVVVGDSAGIDFRLTRAFSAKGRVVDSSGRPVEGVRLSAGGLVGTAGSPEERVSWAAAKTPVDGTFLLEGLSREVMHTLTAMADGFGKVLLDIDAPAADQTVLDLGDLALSASRTIAGRVVDGRGAGLPEVAVEVRGANADRGRLRPGEKIPYFTYGPSEGRLTDDLGRFRFPDLAPGSYSLSVGGQRNPRAQREVALGDADVTDLLFTIRTLHEVAVTVVDDSGTPVADVSVEGWDEQNRSASAVTDTTGRATVGSDLPIRVLRASPILVRGEFRFIDPAKQRLPDGAREARFVLERAGAVDGTVLDTDGTPLYGAILEILRGGERIGQLIARDGGRFSGAVPTSGPVSLALTGEALVRGGGSASRLIEGHADGIVAGTTGVKIRARDVSMDGSVVVRVVAPDGSPAERAQVEASWLAAARPIQATTDASGRATLANLPRIPVRVGVHAAAPVGDLTRIWVRPAPQTVLADGREVVLRLREGFLLRGRLVDSSGLGVKEMMVAVTPSVGETTWASTYPDGRFNAAVDFEAEVTLTASRTGPDGTLRAERRGVRSTDGEVTLTLEPVK